MRIIARILATVSLVVCLCEVSIASTSQAPSWPDRWLAAGLEFGDLKVAYRLTDECDIDPDFEITQSPNLDVTREEIFESLSGFLAVGTRDDPPRDVMFTVIIDVLGEERDPNKPLTQAEYQALVAEIDKLGPWPKVRLAPVGSDTYRCTFDTSGALIRLERSPAGEDRFSDFEGDLSEQGPFYLRWRIEE